MLLFLKALDNTWEFVSKTSRLKPSSAANSRADEAARASISMGVYCCGKSLDIEAKTKPLLSRITAPQPHFFYSLKIAPSQFIFTSSGLGGRHLARKQVRAGRVMEGAGWVTTNSTTRSFPGDRI